MSVLPQHTQGSEFVFLHAANQWRPAVNFCFEKRQEGVRVQGARLNALKGQLGLNRRRLQATTNFGVDLVHQVLGHARRPRQ